MAYNPWNSKKFLSKTLYIFVKIVHKIIEAKASFIVALKNRAIKPETHGIKHGPTACVNNDLES